MTEPSLAIGILGILFFLFVFASPIMVFCLVLWLGVRQMNRGLPGKVVRKVRKWADEPSEVQPPPRNTY